MPDADDVQRPAPPPTGLQDAATDWIRDVMDRLPIHRDQRRPTVTTGGPTAMWSDRATGWRDVGYTHGGRITWADPSRDIMVDLHDWARLIEARGLPETAWADLVAAMRPGQPTGPAASTPASEDTQEPDAEPARRRPRGRRSQQPQQPTPPPARVATPGQASAGGVVDAITAAVEELCGCGCKSKLDPNGPSAYFATAACQRRWTGTQATDPQDVYLREDAARYVGVDSASWPLAEPGQTQSHPRRHDERAQEDLRERQERFRSRWVPDESCWQELEPDLREAMRHRRECVGCGQMRPSRTIVDRDNASRTFDTFGDPLAFRPSDTRVYQVCIECGRLFDGPMYGASVRRLWHGFHFTLQRGDGVEWSLTYALDNREMSRQQDLRAHMDVIWRRMEDQLERQAGRRTYGIREIMRDMQARYLEQEQEDLRVQRECRLQYPTPWIV